MIAIATPYKRYDCLGEALDKASLEHVYLRSPDALCLARLSETNPRYIFFPHWSWKIPPEIYQRYECVIFHMTDVPFGRGGAPLQNLIVRGFSDTQISALRCVDEMDAGPVYAKEPLSLLGTAEEILIRAASVMTRMMLSIITTNPIPVPQVGEPTIFRRRQKADGNIEKLDSLDRVYDYVRMLDGAGYPPAFIETDSFRIEFTRASLRLGEVVADARIIRKSS